MKGNCPNQKHPHWVDIVNSVGVVDAFKLFVSNGYEVPDIKPFKTAEDVAAYLDTSSLLAKHKGIYYVKYTSQSAFTKRMDSVLKMMDKINTMYGGQVLIMDSHLIDDSKTGRKYAHFVDINESVLTDFWRGVQKDETDGNIRNIDGDIMPYGDPDIYYQLEGASLAIEDYKDFKRKTEYMKKFFPGYEVVENWQLPIPAQVDLKNRLIHVNPRSITVDAIGHEFGHILIDAIGGMSNPLVKAAREQLIDHDIEKQVLSKYEDLVDKDSDKLDKEIVAQAMGLESVQLFKDELNQQAEWIRRFRRILYVIKEKLGLQTDAVKQLTNKLVDKNWTKDDRTVQEKIDDSFEKAMTHKTDNELYILQQRILDSLYKKRAIVGKYSTTSKEENIGKIITKIEKAHKNPIVALKEFQDFAKEETDAIYLEYLEALRKERQGESGFSIKQLNAWKNYIAGFSSLNDMVRILKEAASETEDIQTAEKITKALDSSILNDIINNHEIIENAYLVQGRKQLSKFLSKYSNHITAQRKEELEEEWLKLPKEKQKEIAKDEYVIQHLKVNVEKLQADTERYLETELIRAQNDIGTVSRYIDNLLDSPDPIVSSMVNAFTQQMRKSREEKLELKDAFVDQLRELEKFQEKRGFLKSDKQFYDFMLEAEKDDEGNVNYTGHLVTPFNSKFWMDYGRYTNKLRRKNWGRLSYYNAVEAWKNKRAPMTTESKNRYEKARMDFVGELQKKGLLTETEYNKVKSYFTDKNVRALDTLINEEASYEIIGWMRDNSWNYRTPSKEYRNSKWGALVNMAGGNQTLEIDQQIQAVQDNKSKDPRTNFYNFIRERGDDLQSRLPYMHRIRSRLPGVVKRAGETLRAGEGVKASASKFFQENFNIMGDETDRATQRELTTEEGKPISFIPVHFTNRISPDKQSFDIADIYFKYLSSAIDYGYRRDILPQMELTRSLIEQREVVTKNSAGKVIIDKLRGKELSHKGTSSAIAQQFTDWLEAVLYDKRRKDEGTFKIPFTNKYVDKANFADFLNKYTAISLLGGNVVQGTANVILGSTMQWIEAFGGDHYSVKDFLKAKAVYNKNLPGVLGDIGSRRPENLVSLLNRNFDTLNDYQGGKLRRDTRFSQMLTTDTVFFTSHAGEHMMQSKVMLAMLNNMEAKQGDKVIGKMLDMFSTTKEGKLKLDERVTNFGEQEQAIFENKMKRVLSSLHGEYSEMGRVAIQRYALGRMAYMFRKFVIPGFKRRWGKKYTNNLTGEVTQGIYLTSLNFLGRLSKDLVTFRFAALSNDWNSMKTREKAAFTKTAAEVAFLASVSILIGVLENSGDDDEWLGEFMAYQAYRFRAELGFFINPEATMQILRSPAASMSVIENSLKFASQLFFDPLYNLASTGQLEFDEYERGSWKGKKKISKTFINFVPAWKQIYRLKYVSDQTSWLKN